MTKNLRFKVGDEVFVQNGNTAVVAVVRPRESIEDVSFDYMLRLNGVPEFSPNGERVYGAVIVANDEDLRPIP